MKIKTCIFILIFVLSQVFLSSYTTSQNNMIELGYDDGEPESYYTWIVSDAMFLVKFSVNSSAFKLKKIKIYGFYTYTTEKTRDTTFEIEIFDEKLKGIFSQKYVYGEYFNGLPYDEIEKISDRDKLMQLAESVSKWAEITFDNLVVGSTFYVGVHACSRIGIHDAVWIGVDETNPQHKGFLYSPERNWKQLYGFNFMVRIEGSIVYKVEIEAINLPSDASIDIRVTDIKTTDYTIQPGSTRTIFCEKACTIEILTHEFIYERTRYICRNTTFKISSNKHLLLNYTKEFLLKVDGMGDVIINDKKIKLNGARELWIPSGHFKMIVPEPIVYVEGNKRYIFKEWNINGITYSNKELELIIDKPINISLIYDIEYYIKTVSDHGKTTGDGWYKKDTKVEICVLEPVIESQSIIYQFEYWLDNKGNKYYEDCIKIRVSEPLEFRAIWSEKKKINILFIAVVLIAIVILIIAYVILKAQRKKKVLPIPPPPPEEAEEETQVYSGTETYSKS